MRNTRLTCAAMQKTSALPMSIWAKMCIRDSFHIADNSVFTLDIAVPNTESFVNILLRKRTQKFMELWIGFVDHFPVQALAELRYIRIETDQLHILRTKDRTAYSSIALDDSIFTVRMPAGIAV